MNLILQNGYGQLTKAHSKIMFCGQQMKASQAEQVQTHSHRMQIAQERR